MLDESHPRQWRHLFLKEPAILTSLAETNRHQTPPHCERQRQRACTVQLKVTMPPQPAPPIANGPATSDQTPEPGCASFIPHRWAELEAECPPTSTLEVNPFQNEGEPTPAKLHHDWSAPNPQGGRNWIQWLANLPLTENDPSFIQSFTCPTGEQACESQLTTLQNPLSLNSWKPLNWPAACKTG